MVSSFIGPSLRCFTGVTCQCVFLSQVCLHYNKGSGPHGGCTFQNNCTKVHLCQHFVQGDCMFGLKCKRQHAIDQHGRRMLEQRGLSGDVIEQLPFIYRNIHHLSAAAASAGDRNTPIDVLKATQIVVLTLPVLCFCQRNFPSLCVNVLIRPTTGTTSVCTSSETAASFRVSSLSPLYRYLMIFIVSD